MTRQELSWKKQLQHVKSKVLEAEKQREDLKRMQLERSRESLQERLKEDTPEALDGVLAALKKECSRSSREFYATPHLQTALDRLGELGQKLRFYKDCQKDFGKLFTPRLRQTLDKLLRDLGAVQRGVEKQLAQWRAAEQVLSGTLFRPRGPADDGVLVGLAKAFHEAAHGGALSLPKNFFANEKDGFYVADFHEQPYGYVKYWPKEDVITFAVAQPKNVEPPVKLNFNKFIRGLLHHFARNGPLQKPLDTLRVRISYAREAKFFTEIGFVRSETHGMSDWTYSCSLTQPHS